MPYEAAWHQIWNGLGIDDADPALLPALLARYSEPHRKYHTLQHLDACRRNFALVRDQATHAPEVELALWFHDAIYEIPSRGNERQSADWAHAVLVAAGAAPDVAQRVHALVMVTCHGRLPQTGDAALLLDVDLAILGAPAVLFDVYEAQIRAEYCLVPETVRRSRRRRILQGFLDRERIFHTKYFSNRLEAQARTNLRRSIATLGSAA